MLAWFTDFRLLIINVQPRNSLTSCMYNKSPSGEADKADEADIPYFAQTAPAFMPFIPLDLDYRGLNVIFLVFALG